jgi:hypothetical protein
MEYWNYNIVLFLVLLSSTLAHFLVRLSRFIYLLFLQTLELRILNYLCGRLFIFYFLFFMWMFGLDCVHYD